jgi:hypothetical protein
MIKDDEIGRDRHPLLANLRDRQRVEFGMDIAEGQYHPSRLVQDGSMYHVVWDMFYPKKTAQWVVDSFSRSSDAFRYLLVMPTDPEAIKEVTKEFEEKGFEGHHYTPWKWAVPLTERAYSTSV